MFLSTTLNPTADSYTRDGSSYSSTNFGTATVIESKYASIANSGYIRDAFVKFDLSSVSSVGTATLKLWGSVTDSSTLSLAAYSNSTTSWVESGAGSITWNNMPAAGTTALATTSVSGTTAQWYTWDLSTYLQQQKNAGINTVSIEIVGTTSTTGAADFNSREASSNQPQLVITAAVSAPTVATQPSASLTSVSGVTTVLSVLGADTSGNGGEAALTYTWSATSSPSGAAPIYSVNGTNGAKNAVVTFNKAGSYTFSVTITNLSTGQSVPAASVNNVSVAVNQTQSSALTLSPSATVADGGTQQFTATAVDQFTNAMTSQPTIIWSLGTGAFGSIGSTGLYTAPASGSHQDVVIASGGGATGTTTVSVTATLTPTDDSYVYDATPDQNYGSANQLVVKYSATAGFSRQAYLKFPISSLASIGSATLRLYGHVNGTTQSVAVTGDDSSSSWSESMITWNNRPAPAGANLATVSTSGTSDSWYTWNIGSYVAAQKAAGASYVTLVMRGAGDTSLGFFFSSKEGSSPPQLVVTPAADAAPTVATAASASPSTVTGTTTNLSVLGADDTGEANLTYSWSATSVPSGASAPTFSVNGTNGAKNSTATFSKAGSYTLKATITDPDGLTATSSVNVTVSQTLTSISVSPSTASLNENAVRTFSATAFDQFGTALTSQPAFTWTNSGVGSVNSSGLYTAPGSAGSATITATSGSISGNASVTIANAAPTVATPAAASPGTVTGLTASLSALGADDGGESNLTYTWAATSVPSGASAPSFSANGTNAAKNATPTFSAAGAYTFQVTITDQGGLTATSSVSVTVSQTLTTIGVSPSTASVDENATQTFSATALDQFGNAFTSQPTFTWSKTGVGSVNSSGVYTAPTSSGSATVTATSGSVSGNASVTIANAAPTVATPAAASPGTETGTTASLSALGADDGGESNLTYTWAATGVPSGASAPAFSANGTNGAKNAVATFSAAGAYIFQVTITDQGGLTATSSVSVTVNQTTTTITVSPGTATVGSNGTQQFAATALDQFGVGLTSQPTFTWSSTGAGSVNSTGLYTGSASTGSGTVTATSGSVSGGATVTVGGPSVATAASASTSDGINISLAALGSDPGGESTLIYSWAATSMPGGATVAYSDNGDNSAKNSTAAIDTAGTYTFQVTVSDGTNSATSSVSITVSQVLSDLQVTPGGAPVVNGDSTDFMATAYDQFGKPMDTQPTYTWSAGAGSIVGDGGVYGNYTAPSSGTASDTVTVSGGGMTRTASVEYGTYVGAVYNDLNGDGIREQGENGVQGQTVIVVNTVTGDILESATTDAQGDFALPATTFAEGSCQSITLAQGVDWSSTGASIDPGTPADVQFGLMAHTTTWIKTESYQTISLTRSGTPPKVTAEAVLMSGPPPFQTPTTATLAVGSITKAGGGGATTNITATIAPPAAGTTVNVVTITATAAVRVGDVYFIIVTDPLTPGAKGLIRVEIVP